MTILSKILSFLMPVLLLLGGAMTQARTDAQNRTDDGTIS